MTDPGVQEWMEARFGALAVQVEAVSGQLERLDRALLKCRDRCDGVTKAFQERLGQVNGRTASCENMLEMQERFRDRTVVEHQTNWVAIGVVIGATSLATTLVGSLVRFLIDGR